MKRPADWRVLKTGIEHRKTGYWIAAKRFDERRFSNKNLSDWILHLAEKATFDLEDFLAAFRAGIKKSGAVVGFDLDLSEYQARKYKALQIFKCAVWDKMFSKTEDGLDIFSVAELDRRCRAVDAEIERRRRSTL